MILHLSWKRNNYGNGGEEKPQEVMLGKVPCLLLLFPCHYLQHGYNLDLCGGSSKPFYMVKEMRRRICERQPHSSSCDFATKRR